jgi:hypothetical protein
MFIGWFVCWFMCLLFPVGLFLCRHSNIVCRFVHGLNRWFTVCLSIDVCRLFVCQFVVWFGSQVCCQFIGWIVCWFVNRIVCQLTFDFTGLV